MVDQQAVYVKKKIFVSIVTIVALTSLCVTTLVANLKIESNIERQNDEVVGYLGELYGELDEFENQADELQETFNKEFRDNVYGNLALIEQQQSVLHSSIIKLRKTVDGRKKAESP